MQNERNETSSSTSNKLSGFFFIVTCTSGDDPFSLVSVHRVILMKLIAAATTNKIEKYDR